MSGLVNYIIDLETLGLSSKYHEVCEVSIIRCSDRVQLTEFIKVEYPERANYDALKVCNKTMADLEYGKPRNEVITQIDKFLNEDGLTPAHRCMVAHNSPFDLRFTHAMYESSGKVFPGNLWLCTMALTKAYAKKIGLVKPKVNLGASLDICEIKKFAGAHASKVDSRNTYLLWKDLVENKQVDYLSHIKSIPHNYDLPIQDNNDGLDLSLLDD